MPTFTLELNQEMLSATRCSPAEFTMQMKLAAAMAWYREGKVSQEVAASICGLDRTSFLLELARHGENSFQVDAADLREELNRG
jgi:predicted HTH domain antitoxin